MTSFTVHNALHRNVRRSNSNVKIASESHYWHRRAHHHLLIVPWYFDYFDSCSFKNAAIF